MWEWECGTGGMGEICFEQQESKGRLNWLKTLEKDWHAKKKKKSIMLRKLWKTPIEVTCSWIRLVKTYLFRKRQQLYSYKQNVLGNQRENRSLVETKTKPEKFNSEFNHKIHILHHWRSLSDYKYACHSGWI